MVDHTGHHTRFISFFRTSLLKDRCVGHVLMARPTHHRYAPIDKWHIKSLVMTNSLVSTGWEHHKKHPFPQVDGITRYAIILNNLTKGEHKCLNF
jgi:hypothetical protein